MRKVNVGDRWEFNGDNGRFTVEVTCVNKNGVSGRVVATHTPTLWPLDFVSDSWTIETYPSWAYVSTTYKPPGHMYDSLERILMS